MRYFEDFAEGQVIELGTIPVLSEEDIIGFARQYDPQPFHTDPVAAKDTIYGGLIASGWQTALLTMRLMVDALLSQTAAQGSPGVENIRFLKPVRAGDRLRVATRCWWPSLRPGNRPGARSSVAPNFSTKAATSSTRWMGGPSSGAARAEVQQSTLS
jgi:acyl dehydratase